MYQVIATAWTHSGDQKTIKARDFDGLKREAEREGCVVLQFEKREYVYADKDWHFVR